MKFARSKKKIEIIHFCMKMFFFNPALPEYQVDSHYYVNGEEDIFKINDAGKLCDFFGYVDQSNSPFRIFGPNNDKRFRKDFAPNKKYLYAHFQTYKNEKFKF